MLDNFAFLIDTAGHIPNGNRVYYLSRSQPPFFALMVQLWTHTRQDSALLDRYYPQLQREYAFWMDGAASLAPGQAHRRVVRLPDGTLLNRYWDDHPTPRPESYREDVELARTSGRPPEALYRDLRAACESGWDFSSRWLRDGHSLATIRTTELIPADLNCLLYTLEMTLATVAQRQQQPDAAARYRQAADSRRLAIRQYSWDSEAQAFTDYDWVKNQSAGVYSLAGMFPLAMGLADSAQAASMADLIKRKFLKPGGLISTLSHTGQQWDAPNGWAPLQWMTIQGLRQYGYHILADDITTRWVRLNTQVYKRTGRLVEKYNVEDLSLTAGGGEYPLQDGFGWTNGVLLRLLYEKDKSHN
jgi:alpha,alpha-trehalase